MDADYVALSGHKLYAPLGVDVLAARADWLEPPGPTWPAVGRPGRSMHGAG
jgi:selenocysteine lyase/cysteine desulfurase